MSVGAAQDPGVEGNERLTAAVAAALLVLLAAEGVTVLQTRSLLSPHVFIGTLLVPPVLLKMGSTGWRFVRYYAGAPAYRRRGAPPLLLRLLGPVVVVTTVVLFASGIALLFYPSRRGTLLGLHKVSFILWFAAMTVHVLSHVIDTVRLAPQDWVRPVRRRVPHAGLRQVALLSSVASGAVLGAALVGRVAPYVASTPHLGH